MQIPKKIIMYDMNTIRIKASHERRHSVRVPLIAAKPPILQCLLFPSLACGSSASMTLLAMILLVLATPALPDNPEFSIGGHISAESYPGMSLAWREEFSGSSLDASDWSHETGTGESGWGNNELQFYRPENVQVKDGLLVITAQSGEHEGSDYTSSRIMTRGKREFRYGRVDVRALLPEGQGIWPAIWMLGTSMSNRAWPAGGEIDIVEMVGGKGRENSVHGTLHWGQGGGHFYEGGSITLPEGKYSDYFHVFSVVWDETSIRWLVDDYQFFEKSLAGPEFDPFRAPFYLLVKLAVGGDRPGSPDHTSRFPQHLVLDYIRVFQQDS